MTITADLDDLSDPDVLAEEIADYLESALGSFGEVLRGFFKGFPPFQSDR